jgi:AcrR family transcriptional regulator
MNYMTFAEPSGTSLKILAAAEPLFAQRGHAGVSLRQITTQAKVNLAAVNYHYYDKESLYREILTRRLREVNQRRLTLLTVAEARYAPGPVPLAEIVDALARPLFLPADDANATTARLLGRMWVERQSFTDELVRAEIQPAMTRFVQALRRHTPSITPPDFLWRFSLIVGALHHAVATLHDMRTLTNGICRDDDAAGALRNFSQIAVQAFAGDFVKNI